VLFSHSFAFHSLRLLQSSLKPGYTIKRKRESHEASFQEIPRWRGFGLVVNTKPRRKQPRPTGQDATVPDDLVSPVLVSLDVFPAELLELVLETEGEDVDKVVVRGLSFFGVGETGDLDAVDDRLGRVGLGREGEGGGTVANSRDGLELEGGFQGVGWQRDGGKRGHAYLLSGVELEVSGIEQS
jgi:hypothetical protein